MSSSGSYARVELEALEGWLIKKKRTDKTQFFGGDTKRWFKIQKIKGSPVDDLCMCYFKGPNDTEPSGWIYLKDVRELSDDGKIFNVVTTARKITLEAQTKAEHKLWLQGIVDYSPFLTNLVGVKTEINLRSKAMSSYSPSPEPQALPLSRGSPFDDAKSSYGEFGANEPRERTFSRHVSDQPSGDFPHGNNGHVNSRMTPQNSGGNSNGVAGPRSNYHLMGNYDSSNRSQDPEDRDNDSVGSNKSRGIEPRKRDNSRDMARGGTMGNNSGSSTSRMHAYISKPAMQRDGSVSSMHGDPGTGLSRSSSVGLCDQDRKSGPPDDDIDTDYTSLAADKQESVRQRLQQLEDEAINHRQLNSDSDAKSSEGASKLAPLNVSISPAPPELSTTPKGPVSHFQTNGQPLLLPMRDAKSSIDDIISRSSSQCNSARRPPVSNYSPRNSTDHTRHNSDSDEDPVDFSAEKQRYGTSGTAESKSSQNSVMNDDKHGSGLASVHKPPLARGTSHSDSVGSMNSIGSIGERRPPPPRAPPPTKYNAHINSSIPVDNNFASDNWDEDSDDEGTSGVGGYNSNVSPRPGTGSGSASNSRPVTGSRSALSSRGSYTAGVKQDDNWLNDNFDN